MSVHRIVLAAIALAYAWLHVRAGWTLPLPWPDEAHFLWPARSLALHGTLAAPELHPERALHWMPPGYAVVMAAIFELTGPSLTVARHVSGVGVIVAAAFLAALPRSRALGLVVTALFLFNPSVIAIGNIARMEAFVLALVLAGFVALDRDRAPLGLAALAVAAAMHPSGLVFGVAAVPWIIATRARIRPRDRTEAAVLALGLLAFVAAWASTIAGDGFVDDMTFQLARKVDRDLLSPWIDRRTLLVVVVAASLALPARRRERGLLLAAALAALVVRNVGREMWYAAFDPLFYALATFALLDALDRRRAAAVAIALAVLAWPERPGLRFRGMTLQDEPYVTPDTRNSIVEALRGAGTIEVQPRGDAAVFLDHPELAFVDPVRHAFEPDVTLFHARDDRPADAEHIADGWYLIRAP